MPKIFPSKMQSQRYRLLLNICLALVIYLDAEVGRLLGIKTLPLNFSVVWPATGFSLAALILFGFSVWPGIFLGNFLYNFPHLFLGNHTVIAPFFAALAITLGSLAQALVGASILRSFCSSRVFITVKDVFIFFIAGGLVTCMIAATVGVGTLYLYGGLPIQNVLYTWVTFWLGDTMGVYIFTPLLVVWSLQKPTVSISLYRWEFFFMIVGFLIMNMLTFVKNYPLTYSYIPFIIWVTYRFRMHGATLAVVIISLSTIIPTSMGYGVYITSYTSDPLLILVSFLVIVLVVTALVEAAVLNEREAVMHQIEDRKEELERKILLQRDEIQEMGSEISIKEKMASLSQLTLAISTQILTPLQTIANYAKVSTESLHELQKMFFPIKEKLDPELATSFSDTFENITIYLRKISKSGAQASDIAKMIQEQLTLATKTIEVRPVAIRALLDQCLLEVATEEGLRDFVFDTRKEFRSKVDTLLGIPQDLKFAFAFFFRKAIESMKEKRALLGQEYAPTLEVISQDLPDAIEIIIRDNGMGATGDEIQLFFDSFINQPPLEEASDLGLAFAHDVIVHVHKGQIKVFSKKSKFLDVHIVLPRT